MPPLVLTPLGRPYRVTGGFSVALCLDDDHDPAAKPAESLIMQVGGTGIEPAGPTTPNRGAARPCSQSRGLRPCPDPHGSGENHAGKACVVTGWQQGEGGAPARFHLRVEGDVSADGRLGDETLELTALGDARIPLVITVQRRHLRRGLAFTLVSTTRRRRWRGERRCGSWRRARERRLRACAWSMTPAALSPA